MRISKVRREYRGGGAMLSALLALACATGPLHAQDAQQVYKSVDADGHVVYSDRGNSKTAPTTTVHVEQGDRAEAARIAREQAVLKAEDVERTKQQQIDDQRKAKTEHNQQQACERARNNYFHLKDANRIYQRDADGNRVYYSDSDADNMREQALQAMKAACGT